MMCLKMIVVILLFMYVLFGCGVEFLDSCRFMINSFDLIGLWWLNLEIVKFGLFVNVNIMFILLDSVLDSVKMVVCFGCEIE